MRHMLSVVSLLLVLVGLGMLSVVSLLLKLVGLSEELLHEECEFGGGRGGGGVL